MPTTLTTDRLILRQWRDEDREPFAAMNADPDVMRFFPNHLDTEASDAMADRIGRALDDQGWGLWAVEVKDGASFIGFVGLQPIPFDAHFTPALEIGWRLDKAHWGRGYAPEAGAVARDFAFTNLDIDELVSMTTPANEPSQSVMRKLGLTRDPADDFDHPRLPDWDQRRHVLYRITREHWASLAVAPL